MDNLRFLDFYFPDKIKQSGFKRLWHFDCMYCLVTHGQTCDCCEYCTVDEENVNKVHALQGLEFSPCNIRFFRWFGYPLDSLPSNFEVENLFALIMPWSKIKQLWNGLQHLEKLKHINLIHSKHLIRIPDLSLAPNLESLTLQGCTSLIEVHSSIQYLNKLVILNLKGCKSLNSLPANIQSKFLRYLILSSCSNLKKAPKITHSMENVCFDGTSITELSLIENPPRPRCSYHGNCFWFYAVLNLRGCSKLHNWPQLLEKLSKLYALCLSEYMGQDVRGLRCPLVKSLMSLSEFDSYNWGILGLPYTLDKFYSLNSLNLSRNNIEWIPPSLKQLKLGSLDVSYCERLKCLPLSALLIEAYNCISLESCDFDLSSRVIAANFANCLKLDQNMLKANLGQQQCDMFKWRSLRQFLYPGNEIQELFSFQNVGSSITLEMPPLPPPKRFLGLKVCLVVTSQDQNKAPQYLDFCYKVIGIDENGKTLHENCVTLGFTRFENNSLM
ncbi:disease resistance-like protein DSC1 [Pistacia vera]|uniref:disease resistance-like protein DSC1 n=1 Tax=Pistacia vera TaxID=55513 RepID=UPI001263816A|nr:disease resistance-like protein DSC1 [Pistacia vera]